MKPNDRPNDRPNDGPRIGPPGGGRGPGGGLGRPVEKAKDFKGSLKKLARFSKQYAFMVFVAMLLATVASAFTLIGPSKLTELTDLIMAGMVGGIDLTAVGEIATFLMIIYLGFLLKLNKSKID